MPILLKNKDSKSKENKNYINNISSSNEKYDAEKTAYKGIKLKIKK